MLAASERLRLKKISTIIYRASRKVRVLRSLRWPSSARLSFFKNKSQKIPAIEYEPFESAEAASILSKAGPLFKDTDYDTWLKKKSDDILKSAKMLESVGTELFSKLSSEIYGTPRATFRDGETSPLDLAIRFDEIIESFQKSKTKFRKPKLIPSGELQSLIEESVQKIFKDQAPEVVVVDNLSAKVTASVKRIRIRKSARFTQKDINQLINHEALVHVATTLNGRMQKSMPVLGANYGSITKTQEGLAVFSEFITGSVDIKRMRRLSDRVIAIDMAIRGADFIEVYRFFLERSDTKTQAFESARRVFRGGLTSGGAPFTKDIVYLDGLIRVHNFFRAAVSSGREDVSKLIFSGKIDLDDISIVKVMVKDRLVRPPKFIPPWFMDIDFLICYFSFSVFIDEINYKKIDNYYEKILSD